MFRCVLSCVMCLLIVDVDSLSVWLVVMKLCVFVIWMKMMKLLRFFM